jgi:hypothetical protein
LVNHAKLADAVTGLTAGDQQVSCQNYTVDHIDVTGASTRDGSTGVFLAIAGTGANATQAAYLASYVPTVGDFVRVLTVDNSPTILGRLSGLPLV